MRAVDQAFLSLSKGRRTGFSTLGLRAAIKAVRSSPKATPEQVADEPRSTLAATAAAAQGASRRDDCSPEKEGALVRLDGRARAESPLSDRGTSLRGASTCP